MKLEKSEKIMKKKIISVQEGEYCVFKPGDDISGLYAEI